MTGDGRRKGLQLQSRNQPVNADTLNLFVRSTFGFVFVICDLWFRFLLPFFLKSATILKKKLTQPLLHLFNLPTNIELIVEFMQSVSCNSSTTLPLFFGSDIFWISFLPCLCNGPIITLKFVVRILHISPFNSVTMNFRGDLKCIAFYFHGDISSSCMTVQMSSLKSRTVY